MPSKRRSLFARRTRWSLLLLALTVLPLAYWAAPMVQKRRIVNMAVSENEAERNRGLHFIIDHAAQDQAVARQAANLMQDADQEAFLRLRTAVDRTGLWSPDHPAYERWLQQAVVLLDDPDLTMQAFAMQELLRFYPVDLDTRHAWQAAMREQDAATSERMRVAMDVTGLWTQRDAGLVVWLQWVLGQMLSDRAGVRVAGVYHFIEMQNVQALDTLRQVVLEEPDAAAQVRMVHALAEGVDTVGRATVHELATALHQHDADQDVRDAAGLLLEVLNQNEPWPDAPPLPEVGIKTLLRAMRSDDVAASDLACWMLGQDERYAALPFVSRLVHAGLTSLDPDALRSGALLAGLTGQRTDLLVRVLPLLQDPLQRRYVSLALWMQDMKVAEAEKIDAAAVLNHTETPLSTALMACLRRGETDQVVRRETWDALLAPRGELRADLVELLYAGRYVYVVNACRPEAAPPLTLVSDARAARKSYELLRMWWRVNRKTISDIVLLGT